MEICHRSLDIVFPLIQALSKLHIIVSNHHKYIRDYEDSSLVHIAVKLNTSAVFNGLIQSCRTFCEILSKLS